MQQFRTRDMQSASAIYLITGEVPNVVPIAGNTFEFVFNDDYSQIEKDFLTGSLTGSLLLFCQRRRELLRLVKD